MEGSPRILLDDLLDAPSFRDAADRIARSFRERHGLPAPGQLGIVVPEVEAAAARLERERSLGPFFVAEGSPVVWREVGAEREVRVQLGFARHAGVELELIEPGTGTDFFRDYVDPGGGAVVQHLGFFGGDVDARARRLAGTSPGAGVRVRGRLAAGPLRSDFAYMDTDAAAGIVIELIDARMLGLPWRTPGVVYHLLGRVQKWTGKRSFSP